MYCIILIFYAVICWKESLKNTGQRDHSNDVKEESFLELQKLRLALDKSNVYLS